MQLTVVDHPLVQHKLALLREEDVSTNKFRLLTEELARLLAYEATRDLQLEHRTIQAGVAKSKYKKNQRQKKADRGADTARRSGHAQWRA